MKRIFLILALCCALLWIPAGAAGTASELAFDATVQADGSCQVSVTLQPESAAFDGSAFPIPAGAEDILVNGKPAQASADGSRLLVPLPASGGHVSLTYTLPDVITEEKGRVLLKLPLLSGFAYPISSMEFSVTIPGSITGTPSFLSAYHQQNIETLLTTEIDGRTLRGRIQTGLKDHEALEMTLPVDRALFTGDAIREPLLSGMDWAVIVCVALAAAYFMITLMPRLPRIHRGFYPPEGIGAGEVGTCLTGCGTDLALTVITWAQLGYLLLETDRRGRVLLHKRMDMGNERSAYENRCFQNLFGSRTTVDGTGSHYARLSRKMAAKSPLLGQLYRPNSGNPRIFRILCCAAGLLCGVQTGLVLGKGAVGILLAVLLGGLFAVLSYLIQSGGRCLPLGDKTPLLIALGCGILLTALGIFAGRSAAVIFMVLFQFAAGIGAAFGGKRSELGLRCVSQLQGLRRYMTSARSFDLQQLLQRNPNYFYQLAPYALAMGVDRNFARRFGKLPLPDCGCFVTDGPRDMTASQWAARLRRTADLLNASQKRLPHGVSGRK